MQTRSAMGPVWRSTLLTDLPSFRASGGSWEVFPHPSPGTLRSVIAAGLHLVIYVEPF